MSSKKDSHSGYSNWLKQVEERQSQRRERTLRRAKLDEKLKLIGEAIRLFFG